MKNKHILILLAVISILFMSKGFFSSPDEKKIEAVLSEVGEASEFSEKLKPLHVVARLKVIEKHFAKNVKINVFNNNNKFHESVGLEDAKAAVFLGSKVINSNKVVRTKTEIDIADEEAEVSFMLLGLGEDKSSSNYRELFSVIAKMEKLEKNWIFSELTIDRLTEIEDESVE